MSQENIGHIDQEIVEEPILTSVSDNIVTVCFPQNIQLTFEPYTHGYGYQIEGFRTYCLYKNDKLIFKYNSRLYRNGPQKDEHKIVVMEDGITQEKAAEYWDKAKQYITKMFAPNGISNKTVDTYWYHWRVLGEGYFDLERLKKGECKRLEEAK